MWQHLLQIRCILSPILRIVQLAVDEMENVIACNVRTQRIPVDIFDLIGDVVYTHIPVNDHTDLSVDTQLGAVLNDVPFIKQLTIRIGACPGESREELRCSQHM